jgi:hypothetical protein
MALMLRMDEGHWFTKYIINQIIFVHETDYMVYHNENV